MTHRLRTCPRLVAATSALALATVLVPTTTAAADTVTNSFTVPGTYSLTIPLYTTSVQVIATGASGAPGSNAGADAGNGGNGGNGSLVNVNEPVVAGTSIAPGDGDLWVANLFTNSLTAYRPTANGNVAPAATIAGSNTGLDGPRR